MVSAETKSRIVDAAVLALREEGFAGSSARAIAAKGDFTQALVFYHFGTLNELLLAALDRTSEQRMAAYRAAFADVHGLAKTITVANRLYAEDLAAGHITVLCELISGSGTAKELGPQIAERVRPWIELTQETLTRAFATSPLRRLVPAKELAYPVVALYLGIEMLAHLDGDRTRADALFSTGLRVAKRLNRLMLRKSD